MEKLCISDTCGMKPISDFGIDTRCKDGRKSRCKKCQSAYHSQHRQDNLADYTRRAKKWRDSSKEERRKKATKYREKVKMDVFLHYCGGDIRCMCAGCDVIEVRFLCIDHVDGGGRKHRKDESIVSSLGIYGWLRRNGYPKGFQVLCYNCNAAKGASGECPHIYAM